MKTFLFFTFLIFLGGLGKIDTFLLSIIFLFFLFLLFLPYGKLELKTPPLSKTCFIFLLLYLLSLNWSLDKKATLWFFWLFLAGYLFWLFSFNFFYKEKEMIFNAMIFSGFLFLVLFLIYFLNGNEGIGPLGLYKLTSSKANHNHLGDYWALLTTLSLYKYFFEGRKRTWFYLLIIGFLVIFLSMSRASVVSLICGIFFLFRFFKDRKFSKFIVGLVVLLVLFFLYFGLEKSLIFSRQFYFQSLAGLLNYPFGVGMGNFRFISSDPRNYLCGFSSFGLYAEGIIFEMLAGLGILGIVFIYFFLKNIWLIVFSQGKKILPEKILFIILSVNFIFDYTYFIPAMLWL